MKTLLFCRDDNGKLRVAQAEKEKAMHYVSNQVEAQAAMSEFYECGIKKPVLALIHGGKS